MVHFKIDGKTTLCDLTPIGDKAGTESIDRFITFATKTPHLACKNCKAKLAKIINLSKKVS